MASPAEILQWVTGEVLGRRAKPHECPSPQVLGEWLTECPEDAMADTGPSLDAMLMPELEAAFGPVGEVQIPWGWMPIIGDGHTLAAVAMAPPGLFSVLPSPAWTLDKLHELWMAVPEQDRPEHPVMPIVRAWVNRPHAVVPYQPKRRASLPAMGRWKPDDKSLLEWPTMKPTTQHDLFDDMPDFAATDAAMPWLTNLYAQAGGPIDQGGRLPFDLTLFVGALVHLPIVKRDGLPKQLIFPHLREHHDEYLEWMAAMKQPVNPKVSSIEEWLYMDGSTNIRRDWPKIGLGLHSMARKLSYLRYRGYSVQIATPSHIPETRGGLFVAFNVAIPREAAHGARLDWPRFQRYALESATLARAYLSALDHMHRSARNGRAITQEIPTPILGPDGKPMRRKGGKIIRSETETGPNPQARFVPSIDDRMMAYMCGYEEPNRKQRQRSREAFERLHDDEVTVLVQDGNRNSYRLFGPGRERK